MAQPSGLCLRACLFMDGSATSCNKALVCVHYFPGPRGHAVWGLLVTLGGRHIHAMRNTEELRALCHSLLMCALFNVDFDSYCCVRLVATNKHLIARTDALLHRFKKDSEVSISWLYIPTRTTHSPRKQTLWQSGARLVCSELPKPLGLPTQR